MFNAAAEDGIIARNPCASRSVRVPKPQRKRVAPWDLAQLRAVHSRMPQRYRAMGDLPAGCGHRQGEVFGIAADDIGFTAGVVRIVRQVQIVPGLDGRARVLAFAPPKGGKMRDVPLPPGVAAACRAHMKRFPPVAVTLQWRIVDGKPVTVRLVFITPEGGPVKRSVVRRDVKPVPAGSRGAGGAGDRDVRAAAHRRLGVAVRGGGHRRGGRVPGPSRPGVHAADIPASDAGHAGPSAPGDGAVLHEQSTRTWPAWTTSSRTRTSRRAERMARGDVPCECPGQRPGGRLGW